VNNLVPERGFSALGGGYTIMCRFNFKLNAYVVIVRISGLFEKNCMKTYKGPSVISIVVSIKSPQKNSVGHLYIKLDPNFQD
jgi:hypothetical protein